MKKLCFVIMLMFPMVTLHANEINPSFKQQSNPSTYEYFDRYKLQLLQILDVYKTFKKPVLKKRLENDTLRLGNDEELLAYYNQCIEEYSSVRGGIKTCLQTATKTKELIKCVKATDMKKSFEKLQQLQEYVLANTQTKKASGAQSFTPNEWASFLSDGIKGLTSGLTSLLEFLNKNKEASRERLLKSINDPQYDLPNLIQYLNSNETYLPKEKNKS